MTDDMIHYFLTGLRSAHHIVIIISLWGDFAMIFGGHCGGLRCRRSSIHHQSFGEVTVESARVTRVTRVSLRGGTGVTLGYDTGMKVAYGFAD